MHNDRYSFSQKIAEAIYAISGCHVTISDNNNIRVSGTGIYKDKVGEKLPTGSAFIKASIERETIVIDEPKSSEVCSKCEYLKECLEEYEICTPIISSNDELYGIIGIIATDRVQRKYIKEKEESFVNFIINMSKLLSSYYDVEKYKKGIEQKNHELREVINNTSNSIICVSNNGIIEHINRNALKLLSINKSIIDVEGKHIRTIWENSLLEKSVKDNNGDKIIEEEAYTYNNKEKKIISSHIIKIFENGEIVSVVGSFEDSDKRQLRVAKLREISSETSFDNLIGNSESYLSSKEQARQSSKYDSTVLITGESGTGKELFARAIHNFSTRRGQPFVSINCSAIPETLLESELFGYESGAFTGANKGGKLGKMEIANYGTFFLDEIGDLTLYLQAKMLRVLQDMTITRVGGIKSIKLDLKIIAATNKNLEEMVSNGEFREDLYYRLNVIPIRLPSLRERRNDILLLAEYFLQLNNKRFNKNIQGFDNDAIQYMENYDWPGNIRELENVIEYLVTFKDSGLITEFDLQKRIIIHSKINTNLEERVAKFEKDLIVSYINKYGDSKQSKMRIADELGISIATLYRKLN